MKSLVRFALTSFLLFTLLTPALAGSPGITMQGDPDVAKLKNEALFLQVGQCRQEVWSVTQSTAWQKYRQARNQGYGVSNGVFPCYQYGTRGYCFAVFYNC